MPIHSCFQHGSDSYRHLQIRRFPECPLFPAVVLDGDRTDLSVHHVYQAAFGNRCFLGLAAEPASWCCGIPQRRVCVKFNKNKAVFSGNGRKKWSI